MLFIKELSEPVDICRVYSEPIVGDQKALAFTHQQYAVAENIMGGVNCSTLFAVQLNNSHIKRKKTTKNKQNIVASVGHVYLTID